MEKSDIIGIIQGYIGVFVLTYWMIWTYNNYGIWGCAWTFLTSLGGLI